LPSRRAQRPRKRLRKRKKLRRFPKERPLRSSTPAEYSSGRRGRGICFAWLRGREKGPFGRAESGEDRTRGGGRAERVLRLLQEGADR